MDNDTRTADEIQSDIERERAELGDILNSLGDSLSYESLSETLAAKARSAGLDAVDDLAGSIIERARRKPVAAGLVLAGLAWMAIDSRDRQIVRPDRNLGPLEPPRSDAAAPGAFLDPARTSPEFAGTCSETTEQIERLARDAKSLRDRVAEGTESLSEEARLRVVQAREAAADAAEQAVDALSSGARKTKTALQDNPLAVGGIALGIGAVVGGYMILRNQERQTRNARNELFHEADRVMSEEIERSTSTGTLNSQV